MLLSVVWDISLAILWKCTSVQNKTSVGFCRILIVAKGVNIICKTFYLPDIVVMRDSGSYSYSI